MNDGLLSQAEIDALLSGDSAASPKMPELTDIEKDALGEIGNISMGSAATTLSILLSRRVSITTPRVSISSVNQIKEQYPLPYLVIEVGYTHGLTGTNFLAIKEQDALIIADLMMGGDGLNPPTELNELYMSAVSEAMNQMMGSTATSMSTVFKKKIDIAPPVVNLLDFATEKHITNIATGDEPIVCVSFKMEVEDLIDSEIMQIISLEVSQELVSNLMNVMQNSTASKTQAAAAPQKSAAPQNQPLKSQTPSSMAANSQAMYQQPVVQQHSHPAPREVQAVQFAPLQPFTGAPPDGNIGLIMDVPLQVTVELGRTRKLIREILELGPGSVVEIDKLAGEPVDVLVNGKLIAKGEVVVIDENFGVRVTQIISQLERLNNLQ